MLVHSIVTIFVLGLRAVQAVAGSYAAFKTGVYGIGYMKKNQNKIEEAKDGIKNVGIGLGVVMGCQAGIQWLQNTLHF